MTLAPFSIPNCHGSDRALYPMRCPPCRGLVPALVGLLIGLSWGGCGHQSVHPSAPDPVPGGVHPAGARVFRIEKTSDLLRGPLAGAQLGDFRIENNRIALLVQGLGRPNAGAIVDAGLLPEGVDEFGSVSLRRGGRNRTPIYYSRIETLMIQMTAVLRLHGHDPVHPRVRVLTEYRLGPQAPVLEMVTTLINEGPQTLACSVGDQLDLGLAVPFAPGLGLFPENRHKLSWLVAGAQEVSYGYFRARHDLSYDFTGAAVWAQLMTVHLAPGKQATVRRMLAVGGGGHGAALLSPILSRRGESLSRLTIALYSPLGDTLPGVSVTIEHQGKPFAMDRTFQDGVLPLELPPGTYTLSAKAQDCTVPPVKIDILPGQARFVKMVAGPPSRLVYQIREQGKTHAFPVKLTIYGLENTPTPWRGPLFTAKKFSVFYAPTGQGFLPLPPGLYRVVASHGPEYSIYSEDITLLPESGGSLVGQLKRVVDTKGYLGVDLGQMSLSNPECPASLKQRSLANRVEGLGAAIILGPEFQTTMRGPASSKKAGTPPRETFPFWTGFTATTPELGLFSVIPRSSSTSSGSWTSLWQRRGGEIVVLDQGRHPDAGLLNHLKFDPSSPDPKKIPAAFSALSMLDTLHPDLFDALLADWFSLLNAGRSLVAFGASKNRCLISATSSLARTYVRYPPPKGPISREHVFKALEQGQAVVSTGPFIRLTANGKEPGDTIQFSRSAKSHRDKNYQIIVHALVSAPSWMPLASLTIYLNGKIISLIPITEALDGLQLDKKITIPISGDGYIVALVRGRGSLVTPSTTLSHLPPLALTNPIWIDSNGDGKIFGLTRPN